MKLDELKSPRIIFNLGYHGEKPPKNWSDESRAEYQKERDFYSCKTDNENILDYCIRSCEKKEKSEYSKSDEKDILDYSTRAGQKDEGKRFTAFSECGELSRVQMQLMKKKLQTTKSNIWHAVVSFTEEFGKEVDMSKSLAQDFIQSQMKRFLSQTHLDPKNVDWFAAHHGDTNNRHIHIVFFEKEPKHIDRNGKPCYTSKGKIEPNAIVNGLLNFDEYFSEHKQDVFMRRDSLLSLSKEVKEVMSVNSQTYQGISSLAKELPKGGRVSYNSENMKEKRQQIDEIVTTFIKERPEIKNAYMDFLQAVDERQNRYEEYAKENKLKTDEIKIEQFDKLRRDINARLGNLIIDMAKEYKKNEDKASRDIKTEQARIKKLENLDKMQKRKKLFKEAKKKSKLARNNILKTLKRMAQPACRVQDYFKEFYQRLEEISKEQEMQEMQNER